MPLRVLMVLRLGLAVPRHLRAFNRPLRRLLDVKLKKGATGWKPQGDHYSQVGSLGRQHPLFGDQRARTVVLGTGGKVCDASRKRGFHSADYPG